MLKSLDKIFKTNEIVVDGTGKTIRIHSNTSKEQGLFLQQIFDQVKPLISLEVGFAYGISAMFILEKHLYESFHEKRKHIVIEPDDYWGTAAFYNICKENLDKFLDLRKSYSDQILPRLFFDGEKIQYAYLDTTKRFDVLMQDFYFINKILEVGGALIFDDTGGSWTGVQRVVRYVSTLPNYKIIGKHGKIHISWKKKFLRSCVSMLISLIPFKHLFYTTYNFKDELEMSLDYRCIAFQKVSDEILGWDWDKPF